MSQRSSRRQLPVRDPHAPARRRTRTSASRRRPTTARPGSRAARRPPPRDRVALRERGTTARDAPWRARSGRGGETARRGRGAVSAARPRAGCGRTRALAERGRRRRRTRGPRPRAGGGPRPGRPARSPPTLPSDFRTRCAPGISSRMKRRLSDARVGVAAAGGAGDVAVAHPGAGRDRRRRSPAALGVHLGRSSRGVCHPRGRDAPRLRPRCARIGARPCEAG